MKLIGCMILFFSIFHVGLKKAEKLRYSGRLLHDIWYAVQEIGRQIELTQAPLPAIYAKLEKSNQGQTGFLKKLHAVGDFAHVYTSEKESLTCACEIKQTMESFFGVLGKTTAAEQCACCRVTAEKLLYILERENAALARKSKMYMTVAACVGGMFVLFML